MAVRNTIDDRYSNFVLYIEMNPHILIFALFESIFIMIVWNTIDDRYSIFFPLYRNEATFLKFFTLLKAFQYDSVIYYR